MFEKIKIIVNKYENIKKELVKPNIISNYKEYEKLIREQKIIEPIFLNFKKLKKIESEIYDIKKILTNEKDESTYKMFDEEKKKLLNEKKNIEKILKLLLLPKDKNDEKSVIIEIRAGAGGNEAALFASDLFKMYIRFSENKNWRTELLNFSENDLGGYKEIVFSINEKDVFNKLKYESGVHRVQRIPITESSGRIHTSTVTVAVLAEAKEVDINIKPNDIRIDLFCSSGPGGQSVNTTQSAVRITHISSGLTVSCQDEKSQHKNKEKAMKVLRAKLYNRALEEEALKVSKKRKNQVGTGDRSERIRTYNYPQNRITDHRIGLTVHNLDQVLNGNLDEIIENLTNYNQIKRLQENDD